MTDPDSGLLSYAGFEPRNRWHPAQLRRVGPVSGRLTPCQTMNGNCVLIPRSAVDRVGLIDDALVHRYGDIDYGYRARKAGIGIFIAPEPVGFCAVNSPDIDRGHAGRTIVARWKALTKPTGTPMRPMFRFLWRHGGVVGVLAGGWTVAKLASKAIRGW